MDEALKKLLEQLSGNIKAMHETIQAKFSSAAPAVVEAEKDKLAKDILLLQEQIKVLQTQKAIRKMKWVVPGQQLQLGDGEKAIRFGDFLKAVNNKDEKFMEAAGIKTATGMSEGTAADGGYAVPTEYATEIVRLLRQASVARRICRDFPMGTLTRLVPKELTKPTVTWTAEGAAHTKTKPTLSQLTQTAKKVSALVAMTEELLGDNNTNLDQFVFQVVAEALAAEEDKIAFVGDVSGASDPFNGVFFGAGVNSVSLAGAALGFDDLINLLMKVRAPYRDNGLFVLSTTALTQVMKLKDDNNNPIWTMPVAGQPGYILGKRYESSDNIPDTLGTTRTNGTNTAILFGDFGRGVWISDLGGYTVKASDSASMDAGDGSSAFAKDEIWYKFRQRENIIVANGEGLAKLAVPTA